jgi:hypothetical protein
MPEGTLAINGEDGKVWLGDQQNKPVLVASTQSQDIQFDRTRSESVAATLTATNVQTAIEQLANGLNAQTGISRVDDIGNSFDGVKTNFPLRINGIPYEPPTAYSLLVHLEGVFQTPGDSYVVSGDQINFYEPPKTGQLIFITAQSDPAQLSDEVALIPTAYITPGMLDRNYLPTTGGVMTDSIQLPSRLAGAPSLTPIGEPATGIYMNPLGVGVSFQGVSQLFVDAGGVKIEGNSLSIPVGNPSQRPPGTNGMTRIDTTTEQLEFFINGSWKAIQTGLSSAPSTAILDNLTSQFNGSLKTFTLRRNGAAYSVSRAADLLIFLNGNNQTPDTDFTISGSSITFLVAPPANTEWFGLGLAAAYTVGSVSEDAITSRELAPNLQVSLADGNFNTLALNFTQNLGTGLYRDPARNSLGVNIDGTTSLAISKTSIKIPNTFTVSRRTSPELGEVAFNRDLNQLELFDGSWKGILSSDVKVNTLQVEDLGIPNLPLTATTLENVIAALSANSDDVTFVVDLMGSTAVLVKGRGVSSVTKLATGTLRVEFTTPAPDINYVANYTVNDSAFVKAVVGEELSSRTTSSMVIKMGNSNDGALRDFPYVAGRIKFL